MDKELLRKFLIVINFTILGILVVNALFGFLHVALVFIFELIAICLLIYQVIPAVVGNYFQTPNGSFIERRDIRAYHMLFGVLGFFIASLSANSCYSPVASAPFILFLPLFVISFPIAWLWERDNVSVPVIEQSFYKQLLKNKTPEEQKIAYEEYLETPRHWLYSYVPALSISFIAVFILFITVFLVLFSSLFILIFIGYLVVIFKNFILKKKSREPEISEEKLLIGFNPMNMIILSKKTGFKKLAGYVIILFNLLPLAALLFVFLAPSVVSIATFPYGLGLLAEFLLLPTLIFQVMFWFTLLRRFPLLLSQLDNLPETEKQYNVPRLPTGGLISYYASVGFWLINILFLSSITGSIYIRIIEILINSAFVVLIIHSILLKNVEDDIASLILDNLRIPLAAFGMIGWGIALAASSKWGTLDAIFIYSTFTLILVFFFFDMEWRAILKNRIREKSKRCYIDYLPYAVFIIMCNVFIAIFFIHGLIFLIFLDFMALYCIQVIVENRKKRYGIE